VPRVPVSELRVGLQLARAAHTTDGRLLVPAGTPLTDCEIALLRLWGITHVVVGPQPEPSPDTAAVATAALTHAFRRVPRPLDPVMAAIYQAALRCRARRTNGKEGAL
jgi:hypothetical protein